MSQSTLTAVRTNTQLTVPVNVRRNCWRQLIITTGVEGRVCGLKVRNGITFQSHKKREREREREKRTNHASSLEVLFSAQGASISTRSSCAFSSREARAFDACSSNFA